MLRSSPGFSQFDITDYCDDYTSFGGGNLLKQISRIEQQTTAFSDYHMNVRIEVLFLIITYVSVDTNYRNYDYELLANKTIGTR